MNKFNVVAWLWAVLCLILAWTTTAKSETADIVIMAYNVENLFDTVDNFDPNQPESATNIQDPTYLPMEVKRSWTSDLCLKVSLTYRRLCRQLDWSEATYQKKLDAIVSVIRAINGGMGPDILVLEEIENRQVLDDLAQKLWDLGPYDVRHFEGPSFRGIDVAVLSRLPVVRDIAHAVGEEKLRTRDVLEVEFELEGQTLVVAANHWPSQANPNSDRKAAAQVLSEIAKDAEFRGVAFVAAGDFNTLENEASNPVGQIADAYDAQGDRWLIDLLPRVREGVFPPATHYYRGEWSPLDRFLVSRNLLDGSLGVKVSDSGEEIFYFDEMIHPRYRRPLRFDEGGYSDHLPIVLRLAKSDQP